MCHATKSGAFLRNGVEEEVNNGGNKKLSRQSGSAPTVHARGRRSSGRNDLHWAFAAKTRVGARTCGRASCVVHKNLGGISHGNEEVSTGSSHGSNSIRRHQLYRTGLRTRRLVRARRARERTFVAPPACRFVRHPPLHRRRPARSR